MTISTFFVSKAAVRNLKQIAQRRVAGVSSSHLSEAVAFALGFNTYAALRAALSSSTTLEVQKPDNVRLVQRLRLLGYSRITGDLQLLPDLDQSYSPFRKFPLRKRKGVRWIAWRNLVVSAVNSGLDQRVFGLSPDENWWPEANPYGGKSFIYYFLFDGQIPAMARVSVISGDELSIHVVLNPKTSDGEQNLSSSLPEGDAYAQCWLERRLGAWIQDGGESFSCKRVLQPRLVAVAVQPMGYSDQGSFFM